MPDQLPIRSIGTGPESGVPSPGGPIPAASVPVEVIAAGVSRAGQTPGANLFGNLAPPSVAEPDPTLIETTESGSSAEVTAASAEDMAASNAAFTGVDASEVIGGNGESADRRNVLDKLKDLTTRAVTALTTPVGPSSSGEVDSGATPPVVPVAVAGAVTEVVKDGTTGEWIPVSTDAATGASVPAATVAAEVMHTSRLTGDMVTTPDPLATMEGEVRMAASTEPSLTFFQRQDQTRYGDVVPVDIIATANDVKASAVEKVEGLIGEDIFGRDKPRDLITALVATAAEVQYLTDAQIALKAKGGVLDTIVDWFVRDKMPGRATLKANERVAAVGSSVPEDAVEVVLKTDVDVTRATETAARILNLDVHPFSLTGGLYTEGWKAATSVEITGKLPGGPIIARHDMPSIVTREDAGLPLMIRPGDVGQLSLTSGEDAPVDKPQVIMADELNQARHGETVDTVLLLQDPMARANFYLLGLRPELGELPHAGVNPEGYPVVATRLSAVAVQQTVVPHIVKELGGQLSTTEATMLPGTNVGVTGISRFEIDLRENLKWLTSRSSIGAVGDQLTVDSFPEPSWGAPDPASVFGIAQRSVDAAQQAADAMTRNLNDRALGQ